MTGSTPNGSLSGSQSITDNTASQPQSKAQFLINESSTVHVELTHLPLSADSAKNFTRSPTSGATVLFLGTTRSYFLDPSRPVSRLSYSAYIPLALRTLMTLASQVQTTYNLEKIYVAHRLGEVRVAEESIIIAVSSPHRKAAWNGAEELLEKVKERAEIWKREWFVDGSVEVGKDGKEGKKIVEEEVGVWRDNRESDATGRRKADEQT